jgi:hypothetical protein
MYCSSATAHAACSATLHCTRMRGGLGVCGCQRNGVLVSRHTRLRAGLVQCVQTTSLLSPTLATTAFRRAVPPLMQRARRHRIARACVVAWGCALFGVTACLCARQFVNKHLYSRLLCPLRNPLPSAVLLSGHRSGSALLYAVNHAHAWWRGGVHFSVSPCIFVFA